MRWIAPLSLAGLVTLAACPAAKSVDCGGWTCREGNVCAAAPTYCAPPAAVEACLGQGLADLQACTLPGASGDSAVCRGGACFSCAATPDIEGCTAPGWASMSSGGGQSLTSVFAAARGNVYAGGDGGLLHYDGLAWSPVAGAPVTTVTSIAGSGPSDVYVADGANDVYRFDGGAWSDITPSDHPPVSQLASLGAGAVALVGLDGARLYANGAWSSPYAQPLDQVGGTAVDNVYAVRAATSSSTLMHFSANPWSDASPTTFGAKLTSVAAAGAANAYAVGKPTSGAIAPTILRYAGGWAAEPVGGVTPVPLFGVWAADADHAFAVGANETILVRAGGTWSEMRATAFDDTVTLAAVGGTAADDVFAVGDKGTILHYTGIAARLTDTRR